MKKFTKYLAVAAIMLFTMISVAGCGKKGSTKEFNKDTVYSESVVALPFEKGFEPNSIRLTADKIYFCGYVYNNVTYEVTNKWGFMNIDGTGYTEVPLDSKDGWMDSIMVLGNGNVAAIYSDYFEDNSDPDNYEWYSYLYVAVYDANGNFINKINLTEKYNMEWLTNSATIDDSKFMISSDTTTVFFDNSLNEIKKYESEDGSENFYNIYTLRNGQAFTYYWGDNGLVYKYYNSDTNELGDTLDFSKINTSNYSIMQGNSKWDVLFSDSMGVYGYNLGDENVTELMNFVNSDASTSSFSSFISISDTEFLGAFYDWSSDEMQISVAKYTKVDPSEIKDKQTITLGCLYIDDSIRKNVIKFNKSNDEYRIVITDYSMYETEDNWSAGQEKFNSDIASGQGPDIIVSSGTTVGDYASKGLFVDLKTLIEKDSDIDLNDIFPNLIEACSYDGKLVEIAPEFFVQTLAGKTSLLGNRTSWTFDEFNEYRKSLPEGTNIFGDMNRSSVMYSILYSNASEYVDMQNGKCYFDTDEFIKLLEFLKELPEQEEDYDLYTDDFYYEDDSDMYRSNKAVLSTTSIYNIREYNSMVKGTFGEPVTLIGYPSKDGNGSTIFYGTSYAISSKCKNPDAAWQVIRYYLTEEYQNTISYSIPASMKRFDVLAEEAKQKPYYMDGDEKVEYDDTFWINGQSVPIAPITDDEIKTLKAFILTVNKRSGEMGEIETIIEEEAAAFFEGQKSAADVVKIIQSRASIYLKEIQ